MDVCISDALAFLSHVHSEYMDGPQKHCGTGGSGAHLVAGRGGAVLFDAASRGPIVRSATLPYVLVAGIVAAPLIRLAMLLMMPQPQVGVYVLLPTRMDDLLLGVLTAYLLRKPEIWARFVTHRRLIWRVFFGLALGLPLLTLTSNAYSFPMASIGYDWLALFYLSALVLALTDPDTWLGNALRWKWLMGLGIIAYNTYLFHTLSYGLLTAYLRGHGPSMVDFGDLAVSLTFTWRDDRIRRRKLAFFRETDCSLGAQRPL